MADKWDQFAAPAADKWDQFAQQSAAATPAPAQPSIGQRALSNLPRSIANLAQNAFPVQNEQLPIDPAQRHVRGPFEEIGNAASYLGNMIMHPQESFANDPAGTVAIPAMLAHGGIQSVGGPAGAAAVAEGAAKGALEDITGPTKYHYRGIPLPIGVAAPAGVGYLAGGHEGALIGAGLGAAATGVRGAIRGGKQGLQDFRYSQIDKTPNIVAPIEHPTPPPIEPIRGPLPSGRNVGPAPPPAARPPAQAVAPIEHPAPPAIQSIQGPLPSGRKVGGITNQTPAPAATTKPPAVFGDQEAFAKLPPQVQEAVLKGQSHVPASPSTPSPAAEPRGPEYYGIKPPQSAPTGAIPVPRPTVEGAVTKLDMPAHEPYESYSPSRIERQMTPAETTPARAEYEARVGRLKKAFPLESDQQIRARADRAIIDKKLGAAGLKKQDFQSLGGK